MKNINTQVYGDGKEVDGYLLKPYHQKRIQIAFKILNKHCKKAYINVPRNKIKVLDLGGGTGIVAHQIKEMGFNVVLGDTEEKVLKKSGINYALMQKNNFQLMIRNFK